MPVTVVGLGADGWAGLGDVARKAIGDAEVLLGGRRHIELVADRTRAETVAWPSPLLQALPGLLDRFEGRRLCVLASGDPMHHGVGSAIARLLPPGRLRVLPGVSAVALACARLCWPVDRTAVVSAVGRPLAALRRVLAPERRVLVLSAGADTPKQLASLLAADGWGPSEMTVLEEMGGPAERRLDGTAQQWPHPPGAPLNVVALTCRATSEAMVVGEVPGLPDDAYRHDGQLTKREVRAVTLAHLAPRPGELLWDVGGGAGSVGIEWMRAHPDCHAVAVEARSDRATAIAANAARLGVPGLRVVRGRAPEALAGLPEPAAVFVGGGLTGPGVLEACWAALPPAGRLVANAVTVEGEALIAAMHARRGGSLVRLAVARAGSLGGFTGWRPAMPVTIWTAVKGDSMTPDEPTPAEAS